MPIAPIQFSSRGGNEILQNILNGQSVSLSNILGEAVKLNRDINNNQLVQEQAFLGERRFDTTFREERFRDRRNFDREVFTQDRGFSEGVRQFNVLDSDRDSSRALQAELGRGSLGLERERLSLATRESDFKMSRLKEGAAEEDKLQANFDNLRERERIANDPEEFAKLYPELSKEEIDKERAQQLGQVARDYEFFGRPGSADLNLAASGGVGVLPPRTVRDETAERTFMEATDLASRGDYSTSLSTFAKAEAEATPGSPTAAQIQQSRKLVEAQQAALLAGSSISFEAADTALKTFNDNLAFAFADGADFQKEVAKVNESTTREDYARALDDELESEAERDRAARTRGAFFDSVRKSSTEDRNKRLDKDDPFGRYFPTAD